MKTQILKSVFCLLQLLFIILVNWNTIKGEDRTSDIKKQYFDQS